MQKKDTGLSAALALGYLLSLAPTALALIFTCGVPAAVIFTILTILCGLLLFRYIQEKAILPLKELTALAAEYSKCPEEPFPARTDTSDKPCMEIRQLERQLCLMSDTVSERIEEAAQTERTQIAYKLRSGLTKRKQLLFFGAAAADVYAYMKMSEKNCGNIYDFFTVDSRHAAFIIADAAGNDIHAAMFMQKAVTLIKGELCGGASPSKALTDVNRRLYAENKNDLIITAWVGLLDADTGRLTYSSALHEPPVILRAEKCVYTASSFQIFLACCENTVYSEHCEYTKDGDTLILYTDGLTKAADSENHPFGEKKLLETVSSCRGLTAEETVERIFKNAYPASDYEMTVIAAKIKYPDSMTLPARKKNIASIKDFTESCLTRRGLPREKIEKFSEVLFTTLECICSTARPDSTMTVKCRHSKKKRRHTVIISDLGNAPNPSLALKTRTAGASEIKYQYSKRQNILTVFIK